MSLVIDDAETEELLGQLAALLGVSVEQALKQAVIERLEREKRRHSARFASKASVEEILAIGREIAAKPVVDPRTPDEIIGYDEHGLPR